MKIKIEAGNHDRVLCPVSFSLPAEKLCGIALEGKTAYLTAANGKTIPCAVKLEGENAELCFILSWLGKGEALELWLGSSASCGKKMSLRDTDKGIVIEKGDSDLMRYYTATDIAKPHLGHFRDEYGTEITRIDEANPEHPHHRALWISHGDVNGVDTWNEDPEHGYIRVQNISDRFESDVWTGFTAENLWTDHYGKPLCNETTKFRFYDLPDRYTVVDVDITLTAAYGKVTLLQSAWQTISVSPLREPWRPPTAQ